MSDGETRIEHHGHTTFRLERGGRRILIDPVLVREPLSFRRGGVTDWLIDAGAGVDAIVVSHAHDDHLHPPTLLGLPRDVAVYAYGDQAVAALGQLGCRRVTRLDPGESFDLGGGTRVRAFAAAPSVEGTEQCALLIEGPDLVMLDAVDVRDTPALRDALAPHRGRIDLAFLPSAASLQWEGAWNQMDAVAAADLAAWLRVRLAGTCGGALSASSPAQIGILERYPSDRADFQAALAARVEPDRVLWRSPPFRLVYRDHRLVRSQPIAHSRVGRGAERFEVQAVIGAFFAGYHPDAPLRRVVVGRAGLSEAVAAWAPLAPALAAAAPEVEALLARVDPSEHRTVAAVLAPSTLRHLLSSGAAGLAARLACLVPQPAADPAATFERFFVGAEALVRAALAGGSSELGDALACLGFDRAMSRLAAEHAQMRQLAGLSPEQAAHAIEEHEAGLERTLSVRRPVLGPNHVWVDAADVELVTGTRPGPEVRALLCCAGPTGVHAILIDEVQAMVLERCDGRSVPAIARDLAGALSADPADMERAVFRVLVGLSRASVQVVSWSAS